MEEYYTAARLQLQFYGDIRWGLNALDGDVLVAWGHPHRSHILAEAREVIELLTQPHGRHKGTLTAHTVDVALALQLVQGLARGVAGNTESLHKFRLRGRLHAARPRTLLDIR